MSSVILSDTEGDLIVGHACESNEKSADQESENEKSTSEEPTSQKPKSGQTNRGSVVGSIAHIHRRQPCERARGRAHINSCLSPFRQDNWTTFVCFLTPDRSVNQIYIDLIEKSMRHNLRRRFDVISKRDLTEAVRRHPTISALVSNPTPSRLDQVAGQIIQTCFEISLDESHVGQSDEFELSACLRTCQNHPGCHGRFRRAVVGESD